MEDQSLGIVLRALMQTIKQRMHESIAANHADRLTLMHAWAIEELYEQRDTDFFQRDFERRFSVRRSTATRMLQLMERNDLIRRESVPHDARLKKLVLTERALKLHEEMAEKTSAMDARLLEGFTEEEKKTLFALLRRVQHNVE